MNGSVETLLTSLSLREVVGTGRCCILKEREKMSLFSAF